MFLKILILLVVLSGMFTSLYFLLRDKPPVEKTKPVVKENRFGVFSRPLFKRVTGITIILFSITLSFRYIKVLPLFLKVGLVFINFVIVYLVINYFLTNKKTK